MVVRRKVYEQRIYERLTPKPKCDNCGEETEELFRCRECERDVCENCMSDDPTLCNNCELLWERDEEDYDEHPLIQKTDSAKRHCENLSCSVIYVDSIGRIHREAKVKS